MKKVSSGIYNHRGVELGMRWYKEPMRELPNGNGFYGAIMQTLNGDKILCNECGELCENLGFHIKNSHKMNGREYKEKFGLAYMTSLISDKLRMHLKDKTLEWLKSLTEEQKREYRSKAGKNKNKRKIRQPKIQLESLNKRGTCPDQLLDKIIEVSKELGHTPGKLEFIQHLGTQKYVHKIYETFGSWNNAVKKAGLSIKEKTENGGPRHYSDDELLEYLQIFSQENNKLPTYTDFSNGFLPTYALYKRRFSTIERARKLARCEEFIEN